MCCLDDVQPLLLKSLQLQAGRQVDGEEPLSSHCRVAVCQSQDSRQRQTVAFKGQQHHTFIKTSFNYDVDELCGSHPVQKHWMLLIENKHEACRDSSPTYSAVFSMKYGSRKAAVTFFFPPFYYRESLSL